VPGGYNRHPRAGARAVPAGATVPSARAARIPFDTCPL